MKILISPDILKAPLKKLENEGHTVHFFKDLESHNLRESAKNYDALISSLGDSIDKDFLTSNKQLKIISNYAVGYNNIDIEAAKNLSIPITNTPDVLTEATAELAMTLSLMCARNTKGAEKFVSEGQWKQWMPQGFLGKAIKGQTVGVLGLGRIGEAYAHKMQKAFDCPIIYHNRNPKNSPFEYVSFEELLKRSDILSIHCPLNQQNKKLFHYANLKEMRPDSILINTARGELIVEDDLLKVLEENHLHGVGLDVTSPEPMDHNHPLLKKDNCIVLPHIGSATFLAREAMGHICVDNILAAINNKSIPQKVN